MFTTLTQRLILGVYLFVVLSIPIGAYLASQYQNTKSRASEVEAKPVVKMTPKPTTSPAKELLNLSKTATSSSTVPTPTPEAIPTTATSYGPTLSLKISLEGRPKSDQSTRLFVGIVEGNITLSPRFLLSFTVNVPKGGDYSNLSLAGLTPGSKYSALIKGSAQIATSSAFYMSPSLTNLENGQSINLLSGDLNDDNQVSDMDYAIILKALGTSATSSNWNGNADFNKDGVINTLDLVIVSKNIGKVGASGIWTSPVPIATPSASLRVNPSANLSDSPPIGGPEGSTKGHWIWVPQY